MEGNQAPTNKVRGTSYSSAKYSADYPQPIASHDLSHRFRRMPPIEKGCRDSRQLVAAAEGDSILFGEAVEVATDADMVGTANGEKMLYVIHDPGEGDLCGILVDE